MLDGIPIVGLTAPALVSIFVLMIFTGLLIPRRLYKDKENESDRWREAFETEREARATSDKQTTTLLAGQKAQQEVLGAIFKNSERLLEARRPDDNMAS